MNAQASGVKALVFDVFGTVVDWHGSVAREVRGLAKAKGLRLNAARFATAWRAGYRPAMDRVRNGEAPFQKIDAIHAFKRFKPDPEMYLGAADRLSLTAAEVMMVAAHKGDLRVAAQCGLKTAFVKRPHEHGRNNNPDLASEADFTVNAESFLDLAEQLGC